MQKRNLAVDILKTIGTLGVILAHVAPPSWLFDIRVFDVCMLVFASGITLKYHGSSLKDYVLYLVKRFKRLIIPTWIFLCIYFGFSYLMSLGYAQWRFSLSTCVKSFAFVGGIGYIWIIRVYFLMAILSPLIVRLSDSDAFKKYGLIILALLLVVNEALANVSGHIQNETIRKVYEGFLVYTTGYAIVEIVAASLKKNKAIKLLIAAAVGLVAVWFISGFASPQTAKYPPQALYILYGVTVSLVVWMAASKVKFKDTKAHRAVEKTITWISKNSLWIYFWHILPVTFIGKMGLSEVNFAVKWLAVLAVAVGLTIVQNTLKNIVIKRKK